MVNNSSSFLYKTIKAIRLFAGLATYWAFSLRSALNSLGIGVSKCITL